MSQNDIIASHINSFSSIKINTLLSFEFRYIYCRLLLDTFNKFMRRDVHVRYKYLTRMASIIYQVEDLNVLDEIAQSVSGFELEKEFNMAFVSKKSDTKSLMKKWGHDLKEVDKFVRQILDLHKSITKDVTLTKTAPNDDLKTLVSQLKQLFS